MPVSRRIFLGSAAAAGFSSVISPVSAEIKKSEWDDSADVVIAGAGAAGCMAAIEAAKSGKKVLLLQAMSLIGGNSSVSSGWIRSCGSRWHLAHGVKDTAEAYEKDILAYGNGCRDPKKAKVIAEKSSEFVNYLLDIGVTFSDEEDRVNGGKELRIVKTAGRGAALMRKLDEAIQKIPNIRVMLKTRITEVLLDEKYERVIGIKAERKGRVFSVKTPAAVLATGGYGRNQKLIERFTNTWKDTARIMDPKSFGDGLCIASDLGAGTANLNIAMILPTFETEHKIFTSTAPILQGAVFVNEEGHRFTNEYAVYYQADIDMLKQKKVWEIMTPDLHPSVQKMLANGLALRCETLEDAAAKIGCPVENLKQDIEEHNRITRLPASQRKDRFGRTAYSKELKAPFCIMPIMPVMIETVGGILINEKSEVISLSGHPVAKGFYAAGAVAFGEHFGPGYRSGDAYVYAGVTGMVAGKEAAKISS